MIAVMAGNADALRFYARRGVVPGEVLLYRFPRRAGEDAPAGLSCPARVGVPAMTRCPGRDSNPHAPKGSRV